MTTLELLNKMDLHGHAGKSCKATIKGHKVQQKTRYNSGNSGKMFTSTWYIDGQRVSKAKAFELANK